MNLISDSFKKHFKIFVVLLLLLSLYSSFSSAATDQSKYDSEGKLILSYLGDLRSTLENMELLTKNIEKTTIGKNPTSDRIQRESSGLSVYVLCRSEIKTDRVESGGKFVNQEFVEPLNSTCVPEEFLKKVQNEQPWYKTLFGFETEIPSSLTCREKRGKPVTYYIWGEKCEATCVVHPKYGLILGEPGKASEDNQNQQKIAPLTKLCYYSDYLQEFLVDRVNSDGQFYLVPCKKSYNWKAGNVNLCIYDTAGWFKPEVLALEINPQKGTSKANLFTPPSAQKATLLNKHLGAVLNTNFYISGETNNFVCSNGWCLKIFMITDGDGIAQMHGLLSKIGVLSPQMQQKRTIYSVLQNSKAQ